MAVKVYRGVEGEEMEDMRQSLKMPQFSQFEWFC